MGIMISEAHDLAARLGAVVDRLTERPLAIALVVMFLCVYFMVFRKHRVEAFAVLIAVGGFGILALYVLEVLAGFIARG